MTALMAECLEVTSASREFQVDYVRFGQTGLKVSKLCLGTMSMGSSAWKPWVLDEEKSLPILRSAVERGINFFDMANWYSVGKNEEVVGDAEIHAGGTIGQHHSSADQSEVMPADRVSLHFICHQKLRSDSRIEPRRS
jgi:hypothetical protein